jgi:hypothetical protein
MKKTTSCVLLGAAISIGMTGPAHAYLDPGTGSIVLQAIIGGVAAGLFILRGYFYRVRAWLGMSRQPNSTDRDAGK